jgi:dihydroorotate dehydrogenase (NAD+) catalytic subunit
MAADLETELCGINLRNPTILASGILVEREQFKNAIEGGAGAVTIKSVTMEPRKGHEFPRTFKSDCVFLNAMGYPNQGIEQAMKDFADLSGFKAPMIASITAPNAEGFAFLAEKIGALDFAALEIVLSCPHTPGFGTMAGQMTPECTREITSEVRKKTKLPLFVKLSPNAAGIGEIAKAAEKAGADAINAGNTLGPGMVVDIEKKKPVLGFKIGGVSGPALKPIAVRVVYDLYAAVKIPIIGTGGIMHGRDAIEMMMAGASAVGIGTAIYYRGVDVFSKVCAEMREWMEKNGYSSAKELVGLVYER